MTFQEFAKYLDHLEATSSRLDLIDILAQMFGQIDGPEVAKAVYLVQGRVAPFYQPIEIGMAEKNLAYAIALAYDVDRQKVLAEYAKLGDLGKVAEKLSSESGRDESANISIDEVFSKLSEIAQTGGEGSVKKKISLLSWLLRSVGSGAKHLVRIPMGASRLGVGDPTILEAFAKAKLGDRGKRVILEQAYNRTSDLGLIAQTLWNKGLRGVESLDVTVGRPIRSQLCERLPDAKTILEKMGGQAITQEKYDGFRVQIHKQGQEVRLFSRNLEETTSMFPDISEGVIKQVKADSVIFDSEALAYNPESEEFLPFQETTKRRRKYDIDQMKKKLPLKVFVFDLMFLNGKSLIDLPLVERVNKLHQLIKGEEVLIPKPGELSTLVDQVSRLFDVALTKGLEGLILKRSDSKYEAGARNFNWVKLKRHSAGELHDTIDCVILGYIFGRGKRAAFGAGALLVGIYDQEKDEFVTVSKIGTGLTDEEWREIHKRADKIKLEHKPARVNSLLSPSVWIKPEIVIEVLADEITKSPVHTAGKTNNEPGFALRFPRLVRFRESDKKAEDATTVEELRQMYEQQFKR